MLKKILLIGNGAREHAITAALMRSKYDIELYVVASAKNPKIFELSEEYVVGDICDVDFVCDFAKKFDLDFAIVGPENPIEAGVVDGLEKIGVRSASPLATCGRLESSKGFTRDLLRKYNVKGNPKFQVFENSDGLEDYFYELGDDFVVKADGLMGGKGVKVSGDHLHSINEGLAFAYECLDKAGSVVVEEKIVGQEFSLMSFCDGRNTVEMPCVQDHKRAYEGDKGPNTGGMGTYSDADHSLPFLSEKDIKDAVKITKRVALALKEECGVPFKGIMYGGFMAVKDGVRLIEYNARFGDPEAMNVLSLLESDFVDLCEGMINGNLDEVEVSFANKATVCKYVVPEGYPENPVKGEKIEIAEVPEGVEVFYGSVDQRADGLYLSGSRAVAFVGFADSIAEAEALAESAVAAVSGPVFHRKDIGTAEVLEKKVEMMKRVRGCNNTSII